MSRSIQAAQPPLKFIPPNYSASLARLVHCFVPQLMRRQAGVQQVRAANLAPVIAHYAKFQSGKTRLIFAFRHPSVNDPWVLGYTFSQLLPREAKRQNVRLQGPLQPHFMYDRGVPLWAGKRMGWLFSRLGGTSILRGKLDRAGLKSARNLLLDGKLPFLAAPEGATNGHNEVVAPLEPGLAQLAFWCLEDLEKANRAEQVVIIPIGIQYHYDQEPWAAIAQLLTTLETEVGIVSVEPQDCHQTALYQRMNRLGERLLSMMEQHYARFYHQTVPAIDAELPADEKFALRLQNLLQICLTVAEEHFNLLPKGSVVDRCRRLEQASWDQIYREDLDLDQLSPIERHLADRVAMESQLFLWHMRLVESFVSVTGHYVREKPTAERFAEVLLITWETIGRIQGDRNSMQRPRLGKQSALVTVGEAIVVNDRFNDYQVNRRSAKQAVEKLTQDLQTALEGMII